MKSDMTIPPILPANRASVRPGVSGAQMLQLLSPLNGLIGPGQSAQAQVLSLKQADASFQLLLKLTLEGGRQTNVQVSSLQPFALGTLLNVSQSSAGSLTINLQQALSSAAAPLTRLDLQQLPVGTLLQGKVLTTQVLAQSAGEAATYRSLVSVLNTAVSTHTLTLDSPQPLRVGSLLSAQVEDAHTLSFVPLSGRQDQLALAQQLAAQQSRQGSLQGLLSALQKLAPGDDMPDPLRAKIDSLLAALPTAPQQ